MMATKTIELTADEAQEYRQVVRAFRDVMRSETAELAEVAASPLFELQLRLVDEYVAPRSSWSKMVRVVAPRIVPKEFSRTHLTDDGNHVYLVYQDDDGQ